MPRSRLHITGFIAFAAAVSGAAGPAAADFLSDDGLRRVDMRRYWHAELPLGADELVARTALLDDNLYVLTTHNRVFAVHAATGVIRWSRVLAEPDVTVRGPTHAAQYVLFTTSADVLVVERANGRPAGDRRMLRGVVIEVAHDTAEINLGLLHGVQPGNLFSVYRSDEQGEPTGEAFAHLRVDSVRQRYSRGEVVSLEANNPSRAGDRVLAEVILPLESVKLPFAASSAAVADDSRVYVGAADQRLYSIDMLRGFQHWKVRTPETVSATPVLAGDDLYFAGQDGRVVSCTKADRVQQWIFKAEGPFFASPLVTPTFVFAACTDRSLYCLERISGQRVWRRRFDNPLDEPPVATNGRIYQRVPQIGLFALEPATGETIWHRPGYETLLLEMGDRVCLWSGTPGSTGQLAVLDAATGDRKSELSGGPARFADASQANQLIVLTTAVGELMCLRSRSAPHLKPDELSVVLNTGPRGEPAAAAVRPAAAEPTSERPARPMRKAWEYLMEDWFRSRAMGQPAGGHGLVPAGETGAKKPEAAEGEESGEEPEGDEPDEDNPDGDGG